MPRTSLIIRGTGQEGEREGGREEGGIRGKPENRLKSIIVMLLLCEHC